MKRSSAIIFILPIIIILLNSSLSTAEETKKEKKSEAAELCTLSNDELLKQAESIFKQASDTYSVQIRGLMESEKLLNQAKDATKSLIIPDDRSFSSATEYPIETAKNASALAKARFDAFSRRLELVGAEKTFLDKYISKCESAKSATGIFKDTISRLDIFLFEIELRVKDRTLSAEKIPSSLDNKNITQQMKKLPAMLKGLKKRSEAVQEELKIFNTRLEEIKKAVSDAKAIHTSAENNYANELKHQTLEKGYSNQPPKNLLGILSDLQEERGWLNSTFNLSHTRFSGSNTKAIEIQKSLESAPSPDIAEILQAGAALRAEEMEQATVKIGELAAYHSARIEKFGELRSSLESMIKHGEVLQGDATVLSEHLSRMLLVAKILEGFVKERKIKSADIPEECRSDLIAASRDDVSKRLSEALSAAQKAKGELDKIAAETKKSDKTGKEAKDRLAQLKKSYESAKEASQWDESLKNFAAQDILEKFKDGTEKIQNYADTLQNTKDTYQNALKKVDEIRQKRDSLKGKVRRSIEEETIGEKKNIFKRLYQLAGMELPAETEKKDLPDDKKTSVKPSEKTLSDAEAEQYQNLLSNRSRIIEEQQKGRTELLNALKELNQQIEGCSTTLAEAVKLMLQNHANAIELKKRLGRGQINSSDIPDGINNALKREQITKLETEMADMMTHQTMVRQETENLGKPDKTLDERYSMLTEILSSVGKRGDIRLDLEKLNKDFERKRDSLSKIELQSFEHKALRSAESDESLDEYLLSFFPSGRSKNLTELLNAYYQELLELDNRKNNLKEQKEKTEHLIRLCQKEKDSVSNILPLLKKQIELTRAEKDDEWVKVQAWLMPDKAQEILVNHETKTGRRLSIPLPVADDKKAEMLSKTADFLFEYHTGIIAEDKWISLFEQRFSSTGLGAEIGRYQDQMGTLKANDAALVRKIQNIKGHSQEELAKLTPEETPKTESDMLRFLKGEIGVLRADRYKVRVNNAVEIVVKLAGILLMTLFFRFFVNYLINRIKKRAEGRKGSSVISVLPLLKTVFMFMIWSFAAIAVLDTLGFNVGTILAGLGIGGLAIAMASKDALSDIIGGVSIFLSRSFKVGDVIMFKSQLSLVEEIGVRYTRLKTNPTNFLITVPNSKLAQSEAINVTALPGYFVNIEIPLSIFNTVEKIQTGMKSISDILDENPETTCKFIKFRNFNNYSFVFLARYIIKDFSRRHNVQTIIHAEIVKRFQENHIEFAVMPNLNLEPDNPCG